MSKLTELEKQTIARDMPMAELARRAGRAAYIGKRTENPPVVGSLGDCCWQAGFRGDVRSVEQLILAWMRKKP